MWNISLEVIKTEFIHEDNRIYLNTNGAVVAEITFPAKNESVVDFDRTYVDPSLRGQGLAEKLMFAAVEDIKSKNLKASTTCPFAAKWFEKHPEYSNLLER